MPSPMETGSSMASESLDGLLAFIKLHSSIAMTLLVQRLKPCREEAIVTITMNWVKKCAHYLHEYKFNTTYIETTSLSQNTDSARLEVVSLRASLKSDCVTYLNEVHDDVTILEHVVGDGRHPSVAALGTLYVDEVRARPTTQPTVRESVLDRILTQDRTKPTLFHQ